VAQALRAAGLDASIVQMPASTRTAEEAADACQCSPSQIVKSLVFQGKTTGTPLLLLVSGTNRVDVKLVAGPIGESLGRPDANYVREVTGFAIGGIPPLGHASPLKTYFDEDLLRHERVWAAAGTPNCVFCVHPADLAGALGATTIRVC
jgi:prolyl-tRNA editing enzyme YbaK/EbsC (Cys-tRNA(Pro) deacylase)